MTDELVLVGWLDPDAAHRNRYHPSGCMCSVGLRRVVHRPEHRIYQKEEASEQMSAGESGTSEHHSRPPSRDAWPCYHSAMETPERKWVTLVVQITPDQHTKLKALAASTDRSMAATVRRLIDRATP